MAKFYNTFEFIGDVQTAKDKTKIVSVTMNKDKTWETTKVTMGIKKEQTNSVFLDVKAGAKPDGSLSSTAKGSKAGSTDHEALFQSISFLAVKSLKMSSALGAEEARGALAGMERRQAVATTGCHPQGTVTWDSAKARRWWMR